ncbi:hypothetical protein Pla163_35610 [Planctomycetes bacterium Pla163]|uniref:Beta-lactamase hydrolase-like protein phosphatase-like domain-containing protein n=1 Tax=Rohdeia mirabilis TaxID=2528008 RepID=A0A518D4M3_9BACT|nr:hypothetical protein Pla163_35610 [Planctomycetes bacterium Pla163]
MAGVVTVVVVTAFGSGCASSDEARAADVAPLETVELGALDSVFRCGDLYLASEPDAEVLDLAARRGFGAVIDLRNEAALERTPLSSQARRLGLSYSHVAIDPLALDDAAVDRVLAELDALSAVDAPVLLFSDTGDGSATVFAIYRAAVQGVGVEEALADGRAAGMKPGVSEAQVVRQVERLLEPSADSADATNAPTTPSTSSSESDAGGNA